MGKGLFARITRIRKVPTWLLSRAGFLALLLATFFFSTPASSLPQVDAAPTIVDSFPAHNANKVYPPTTLSLTFSEPVALAPGAVKLDCATTTNIVLDISDGPATFSLTPDKAIALNDDCTISVLSAQVTDLDTADPPDLMLADQYLTFHTALTTAQDVIINEIDAIASTGEHEFVELYDGGAGNTPLDGLRVVLYQGSTDTSYISTSLNGFETDSNGYFLLSSDPAAADLRMANHFLLNGPAAVALYYNPGGSLPIGSSVTLTGLQDAVVFDSGQPDDPGLLPLLATNEPQIDESGHAQAAAESNQRCPNGFGGQRHTSTYRLGAPTPDATNSCVLDAPPEIMSVSPASGANVDPLTLNLQVTFSEPVALESNAFSLDCLGSGQHSLTVTGGPSTYTAVPQSAPASGDECTAYIVATAVSDLDALDPPDELKSDSSWSFATINTAALGLLINEVDSDTIGADTAEFIELYDGGKGSTRLDDLTLVLFNGTTGKSYRAIDLDGFQTDSEGYFVVGSSSVGGKDLVLPDATLQNGPDAMALYMDKGNQFPNGSVITVTGLIDAFVYGRADSPSSALLALLEPGETQVDENGRGAVDVHSNQRCPNGAGAQRQSNTFHPNTPTPNAANVCIADNAPWITITNPADGAQNVSLNASLTVGFSEAVGTSPGWAQLECSVSGSHTIQTSGGPESFALAIGPPLAPSELCAAKVLASLVNDLDADDPPDHMGFDFTWTFQTAEAAADFVVINEADTNTPGVDTAEFIELYDGGRGETPLDGLSLVLFNGSGSTSYQALGLDGRTTDAEGYFVIGSAAVSNVDLVINSGLIQNGPDAVALYTASTSAFPNNTPVTTSGLLDALVYGDEANSGLQVLLNAGQGMVNENGAGSADTQSMQRCPNGSGGPRNTATIRLGPPTPGEASSCPSDVAPQLISTSPTAAETGVATDSALKLTFSEPVQLAADAITLHCDDSGSHVLIVNGGPVEFSLQPATEFLPSEGCYVAIRADGVADIDTIDPPDTMSAAAAWAFETAAQPAEGILINEFDVDTPGTDRGEFIELTDGGQGGQSLDGYVLVLFNGQTDLSYRTIDLSGVQTDASGFLVIGGPDVASAAVSLPIGALQNGADAIALYRADPALFPNGTSLTLTNLEDAIVYGTADPVDSTLLALLLSGQPQIDESSRDRSSDDSNQRCGGAARETADFTQREPTPGTANNCLTDQSPLVVATLPVDGEAGVAAAATLSIEFSEAVVTDPDWLRLVCETAGIQSVAIHGGPTTYTAMPNLPLPAGEHCEVTLSATKIHDADTNDPPDTLAADFTWSFDVEAEECAAAFTPIGAIQGTGSYSPLQSQIVTTMGVITADFRDGLSGLFVQSPDDQVDANPVTADGILVELASGSLNPVVGDRVMVTGRVAELRQRTTLIDAEITAVCASGVTVTPKSLESAPGTAAAWESLEGMLVTLGPATITDNSRLVSAGELSLTLGPRPVYPTENQPPGPAARAVLEANWARMFILDDGKVGLPPDSLLPTADQPVRSGNAIPSILGIVDGIDGGRRIQSMGTPTIVAANPRPAAPTAAPGAVRIATIDLGVYANGNGEGGGFTNPNGAQSLGEYERQRAKIVAQIHALSADIIAINGIENDGYGPNSATQDLLDAVNTVNPGAPFLLVSAANAGPELYPVQSAILYRPSKVLVVGFEMPTITAAGSAQTQVVWLQEQSTGEDFSIVLLHLDPRDQCPTGGPDADQFDGQACWNRSRTESAEALGQWLSTNNYANDALLLGNWNAFAQEEPLQTLLDFGFSDLTPPSPTGYTTAPNRHLGAAHRLLAGKDISTLIDNATTWHINADESPAFDYRLGNPANLYAPDPYRAAAADPLVIDLNIGKLQVSFGAETPVFIGEAMHFLNQTSGTGPMEFSWNFGDGTPRVDDRHPIHTYKRMGTYEVTLTASDARGSDSFSLYVDVLPRRIYLPIGAGGR